jgi:serine/threonine-protein phosphatase 2B regulatory subunit
VSICAAVVFFFSPLAFFKLLSARASASLRASLSLSLCVSFSICKREEQTKRRRRQVVVEEEELTFSLSLLHTHTHTHTHTQTCARAEISSYCSNVFTSAEIQTLYKRFQQLDKKHKGYISEDELLNIPELAINPLAPRIVQLFVNVNFKEFCRLLSLLSKNADEKAKILFMFRVYDVDADGIVSRNDLEIILRQLVGSTLSEEKIDALVQKAMNEILDIDKNTSSISDSNNKKKNNSNSDSMDAGASSPVLPGLTERAFCSVFSSGNAGLVPTVSIHEDDD